MMCVRGEEGGGELVVGGEGRGGRGGDDVRGRLTCEQVCGGGVSV